MIVNKKRESHLLKKKLNEDMILKIIGNNMDTIKKYGVANIGLFGSYSRNTACNNSDIDVLVDFEKDKKTYDNYMDLKFFLEDLFKRKVDLVIFESIKPALKKYILEDVKYARL